MLIATFRALEFRNWRHSIALNVARLLTSEPGKCQGVAMSARSVVRTSMFAEIVDITIRNRTMNVGNRRQTAFKKKIARIFAIFLCRDLPVAEFLNETNKRPRPKHCLRRSEEEWLEQIT
jgi:hypothetical protein